LRFSVDYLVRISCTEKQGGNLMSGLYVGNMMEPDGGWSIDSSSRRMNKVKM